MSKPKFKPPEICPVCGEDVPPNALACPECGADEQSGWKEGAEYESLDLPGEEFDYDQFVENEFGTGRPLKKSSRQWFWWVAAVLVLVGLILVRFFG